MNERTFRAFGIVFPRIVVGICLSCAGLLLAWVSLAAPTTDSSRLSGGRNVGAMQKIAPWVTAQTANGRDAEFLVILNDQASLSDALAATTKQAKTAHVRDVLWEKAESSQGPMLEWLRARGVKHRAYYIVNAVWVKADRQIAMTLAERDDVLRIDGNPLIRNMVQPMPNEQPLAVRPNALSTVEPNIDYTHAPDVWALGFKGQGIVVGNADTGFLWDHTALKNQYRGWNGAVADHDFNWHDSIRGDGGFCGPSSPFPCDDLGHGSHTMGIAVGDDGGTNQIGMAPDAKWIGCRNMDQGNGKPDTYLECMEFFLAPYPVNGTPAQGDSSKAPDVINNSWECPPSEGCSAGTLQSAVAAVRAAGIFFVAGAGNDGQTCSTIQKPPGLFDDAYTVGALSTGTDAIASFSSRGPVTIDGSSRRKPDITAPGTAVRSVSRFTTTAYTHLSGTSMAAPHVAGAVALMWSADPALRNNIAETERILDATAVAVVDGTCPDGEPVSPNNTYGFGRLDVKAAVAGVLLDVINVDRQSANVVITFRAIEGEGYRLQRNVTLDNRDSSTWADVPGVADLTPNTTGPAQLVHVGGVNGAKAFYRVRLL